MTIFASGVFHPASTRRGFASEIVERVKKSQNKRRVKKSWKAMKLGLSETNLGEFFLDVLAEEQFEDNLWMEFVELCGHDLGEWLLDDVRSDRHWDSVLHHTRRLNFDIFEESRYDSPVSRSIMNGLSKNVQILLKYGYPAEFHWEMNNMTSPLIFECK